MLRTLSQMVFFIGLLVVIALSVAPQGALPDPEISDKLAHMAAYAALALTGGVAYKGTRSLIVIVAGLLLMGIGLEFVQALVPGRSTSGYDVLANVVGIGLGSFAAISTIMIMNRRRARFPE